MFSKGFWKLGVKNPNFYPNFLHCRTRKWRRRIQHGWRPNRSNRSRINCWRSGRKWSRRRASTSGVDRSATRPSDSKYCVRCVCVYITVCCLLQHTYIPMYLLPETLWYYPYKIILNASVVHAMLILLGKSDLNVSFLEKIKYTIHNSFKEILDYLK